MTMVQSEHTEIFTLDECSSYPMEAGERRLRRHTIDLRPEMTTKMRVRNWFQTIGKSKPQLKSIFGGLMVFLGASIHAIWGHWRLEVVSSWKQRPNPFFLHFVMCLWYLSSIAGTIFAALLIKSWTKKQLYYLGTAVLALSGVMYIIWHSIFSALLTGRALTGFCNGFIFLTLLIHTTENVVKEVRGFIISFIGFVRVVSVFLASLIFVIPYYNPTTIAHPYDAKETIDVTFNADLLLGIVTFIYAIIALLLIPYLTIETVVFHIRQGQPRKALENLIRLRSESTETVSVRNEFEELQLMVQEDFQNTNKRYFIFGQGNWRPLLSITAVRMIVFLSTNLTLQLIATIFVKIIILNKIELQYALLIVLSVRVGFSAGPVLLSDRWGRKWFFISSGVMSGLCLGGLGFALVLDKYDIIDVPVWVVGPTLLAFYIFASMGIDEISNVLMSEAFPVDKKAWSIAFVMVIENALQCFSLVWVMSARFHLNHMRWFIFSSGLTIFMLTLWLQRALPETRGMSLRQCRSEFNASLATVTFNRNTNERSPGEGITYS